MDARQSVVVIEHNTDVMRASDWMIELGPDSGSAGGTIVVQGPPSSISADSSITGRYLSSDG